MVDYMCREDLVHAIGRDTTLLKSREIFARSPATDDSIRSGRNGCLIDNAVASLMPDSVVMAPMLRKDVMNVDAVIEVACDVDRLACSEVFPSISHQQRRETLVSRTVACSQREQAPLCEGRLSHRAWLRSPLDPDQRLGEILRKARFYGSAV